MRHFEGLQDKIRQMERRHQQRERELQQIIHSNTAAASADLNLEVAKWKTIVDGKNHESEKFRSELDSILEVLRELQKQGVIIPCRSGSRPGSRPGSYR